MACSSLDCTFEDLSTDADGTVVSWAWEFGDDESSNVQNPPVHHYDVTTRTLFTAQLTVTDDDGHTSTKTTEFTVSPAAELQCESAPGTGEFASCELELLADATVYRHGGGPVVRRPRQHLPDHRSDRGDAVQRRLL